MAHMMKYTKAKCGHMFAHFDRSAENIGNENLDRTRTHLNYNLAAHQQISQGEFVRKRCGEVRCQNRKDVNVMVSWIVTAPKDLPDQEQEQFFQSCYDFLCRRYGRENVVSAYVHMDEVQPHMHFAFVPVVEDKKKGGYKVSAKEAVSRHDLQTFHQDLQEHVENVLGHKVSILNEATREGNRSINELKRQSAEERIQEASLKASRIVFKASKEAQGIKDRLAPLKAEYEAKKAFLDQSAKDSELSNMYPSYAKVTEKGVVRKEKYVTVPAEQWEKKHVSANEHSAVLRMRDLVEQSIEQIKQSSLAEENQFLKGQLNRLKHENQRLKNDLDIAKRDIHDVQQFFDRHPGEKKSFLEERANRTFKGMELDR